MALVAPSGPMYQAGTLSGNPLAMAAGAAALGVLRETKNFYVDLERSSATLVDGIVAAANTLNLPVTCNRVGSMFTLFFTKGPVVDYRSALTSDTVKFAKYFRAMLERGIALPPSQFEAAFVSAAHTTHDIQRTIEASREALRVAFA